MLALMLIPSLALAGHIHPEAWYQKKWCDAAGGKVVTIQGKEIDCLTDTHAVEVEFAGFKSYESMGQTLRYMRLSKRERGGILFIVETPDKMRFVDETVKDIMYHKSKIDVWTIRP